jgi:hypothetical protein
MNPSYTGRLTFVFFQFHLFAAANEGAGVTFQASGTSLYNLKLKPASFTDVNLPLFHLHTSWHDNLPQFHLEIKTAAN